MFWNLVSNPVSLLFVPFRFVSFRFIPFRSVIPLPLSRSFAFSQQIAQKTDAQQLCRTLLVSDKARVTVMPSMEIIANDVKCTHGATICDLEDEELFYLMTRGISKIQVRRYIV